jgi:Rod binding domain-containing protein
MTDISALSPAMKTNLPERLSPGDQKLMDAAKKLEASFLAEMLKSAGFGKPREGLGGGAGEEQFGSFLREAQATAMVETGGIGLAQSLFEALKENSQ